MRLLIAIIDNPNTIRPRFSNSDGHGNRRELKTSYLG